MRRSQDAAAVVDEQREEHVEPQLGLEYGRGAQKQESQSDAERSGGDYDKWGDDRAELSQGQLVRISMGMLGLMFGWAMKTVLTTPLFRDVYSVEPADLGFVWLAGPLSGLIVQPIIGVISDHREGQGQRSLFFAGGAIVMAASLALLPAAGAVTRRLFSNSNAGAGLAVSALWSLDLAMNASLVAIRAVVADCAPARQQPKANTVILISYGAGTFLGYGFGAVDVSRWLGLPSGPFWKSCVDFWAAALFLIAGAAVASREAFLLERPQTPPSPFSLLASRDHEDRNAAAAVTAGADASHDWLAAEPRRRELFSARTAVRDGEGVNGGGNTTSGVFGDSSGRQGEQHWEKNGVVRQEEGENDGQSRGISANGSGDAGKHGASDALANGGHVANGAFGATGTNGHVGDAEGGGFDRRRENSMDVPSAVAHNGNHNHIGTNTNRSSNSNINSSSINARRSISGADRVGLGHDMNDIPVEELCRSPGGQWTTRRRHGDRVPEDSEALLSSRNLDKDLRGSSLKVRALEMALFYDVPGWLMPVCLLLFFSWVGWFAIIIFGSDWVGVNAFGGDPSSSSGDPCKQGENQAYEDGVAWASIGLALQAVVVTCMGCGPVTWLVGACGLRGGFLTAVASQSALLLFAAYVRPGPFGRIVSLVLLAGLGMPLALVETLPYMMVGMFSPRQSHGQLLGKLNVWIVLAQLALTLCVHPVVKHAKDSDASIIAAGAAAAAVGMLFVPAIGSGEKSRSSSASSLRALSSCSLQENGDGGGDGGVHGGEIGGSFNSSPRRALLAGGD